MAAHPSIWYGEVNFIIRNQVEDMVLMHGICHVSKGEKDGDFSTKIPPKRSAFIKVKASHMIAGRIRCCLVYELIDQRNEHKPIVEYHQIFVAVRVSTNPFIKKYKASAAIFMARKGLFTGSKDNMKQLKRRVLQEHLVNNAYSFICTIRDQTLRLKVVFHPGRHASIEVTLEETDKHTNKRPVLFE
jgi:hypothetical protein